MNSIFRNQQVTKVLSSQVGTSETIRLLSDTKNISKFYEWLAGLIDGNGCFLLTKKGYASLEITIDLRDEMALYLIKQHFGGSIKLRSGNKSVRYRLHDKKGLINLILAINGNIRNPTRLLQLSKIAEKYNIDIKLPLPLTYDNNWLSGFLDADGTITINKTNNQLSIYISQKNIYLLEIIKNIYGGNIYIDKSKYESYKQYYSNKEDILFLLEYLKISPLRTAKKSRISLIKEFYYQKSLKLDSINKEKAWKYFYDKWLNYLDK